MKSIVCLRTFRSDESGAVTIPWVILAFAVSGAAIATIDPVSEAASRLTNAVSLQLGGTTDKSEFN